nr:hypothetical protein [Micromonospora maritima]
MTTEQSGATGRPDTGPRPVPEETEAEKPPATGDTPHEAGARSGGTAASTDAARADAGRGTGNRAGRKSRAGKKSRAVTATVAGGGATGDEGSGTTAGDRAGTGEIGRAHV